MLARIERDTVGSRVYGSIRADILMGRLRPGQKLTLDQMAREYHSSVSTLREVLNRLSSEKLVVAQGQRGFDVAPISIKDLRETAALRLLLECHALEQSFARGDMEWEGRVIAAHHNLFHLEKKMKAGIRSETENWKRCDWQFHQTLISACGSRTLMQSHAAIFDRYLRYQMVALGDRGRVAVAEHKALLDCALSKDSKRATEVLKKHISGGVEHALATGAIC